LDKLNKILNNDNS